MSLVAAKKPFHHLLITDIIIFAPIIGIPAAVVDLILAPPHGWQGWGLFLLAAALFTIVGTKMRTLGISLGFHRQGTHPSYETRPWLRFIFFALGAMTAQGKMVNWLSDHHHHHIGPPAHPLGPDHLDGRGRAGRSAPGPEQVPSLLGARHPPLSLWRALL